MIKKHIKFLLLSGIGIVLFSLSFPGYFNEDGLSMFAFIAMLPMFYMISEMNYKESIFYGFIYGVGTYLMFNYWLKTFDPVTFSVLPTIMGIYHILLFLLCKYIYNSFSRLAYIPLTLAWLAYEVFKGENFVGYTYGTLAHSMYRTHIFTGIADFTGTYIVSLLIVFPSVFVAVLLVNGVKSLSKNQLFTPIITYSIVMIFSILYTQIQKIDYSDSRKLKVGIIQHNIDSWATGESGANSLYRDTLNNLLELSTEAQKSDPDVVIWSETAFVPAIEWHKKNKSNLFRLNLIKELEAFVSKFDADYIIGSNETIDFDEEPTKRYNSLYHYVGNQSVSRYRKMKLVPFTEMFPFPELMPWLYTYIKSIGGKDLSPGEIQINFNIKGVKATPLICYEDTFSSVARDGIKNGGDLIINATNDAWSTEPSCSKQHLSASIFRTIENRRSFVRVGTGGYSGVIDPNGKILTSLPVLIRGQLSYDVPIYNEKTTFYTKFGDIIEKIFLIILLIFVAIRPFKSIRLALQPTKIAKLSQE
ncbi:MAG: apolipoprotein N-acyltransferase [Spirochaetaceae bacterium]